jgi:predicted metal-dependent hydrolase
MKREISLHNRVINYSVRRSKRAKRMRLTVYCDGNLTITVPQAFPISLIDRYIIAKSKWLILKIDFFEKLSKKQKLPIDVNGYEKYKDRSMEMIKEKLNLFNNKYYKFKFNEVKVKDLKTRWGSCSRNKNLNFNFKVLFLAHEIQDYIIVHELCHLKEFNHSRKFWNLVRLSIPDYELIRKDLNINGLNIT